MNLDELRHEWEGTAEEAGYYYWCPHCESAAGITHEEAKADRTLCPGRVGAAITATRQMAEAIALALTHDQVCSGASPRGYSCRVCLDRLAAALHAYDVAVGNADEDDPADPAGLDQVAL